MCLEHVSFTMGPVILFDADKSPNGRLLTYNAEKTSVTIIKEMDYHTGMPAQWDVLCGPPPAMPTDPNAATSQICALYFFGEDKKCVKKVNGAFVVDTACDKENANASQVRLRTFLESHELC